MRASERTLAIVGDALKEANLPELSWYDALLEIEKAGANGIRPYELRDRLLMPQYGTSRLLTKIEQAGFTKRIPCAKDGRGHAVQITHTGKEMRAKMWPVYAQCLKLMIEQTMTPAQADQLGALATLIQKPSDVS